VTAEPEIGTSFFSDGGPVGADLGQVDWAATPLGPPADWPQSLRTTVTTLLASRFSMWMAWGPELTFFCNDAYRRDTLGRKYPWALGRPASEVWEEIWPDVGPRINRVLATGEATWDEGLLLFLERSGYQEESYHTFSYSPLRDDDGTVVGMLCVVSEDTARVIGERRMTTLRDLGSDPTVVRTEEEMLAFTARQLERNPQDLPFTLTYLLDAAGEAQLAASTGLPAGHPAAPPRLDAGGPTVWPVREATAGRRTVVDLVGQPFVDLPRGAWSEPPLRAKVTPLVAQGGTSLGFLVTGLNRYRPFDEGYRGFLRLVGAQIAGGVASARSYAAQQQRAEQLAELDRAKTVFFSNISHEFRTPLTLILGPIAELRSRPEKFDDQTREELDVVNRNGLRLAKLVNTLLDFSRIEAGRMEAHYEPVDLARVTAELAGVFRSAIEGAGLTLNVECPALQSPAYIDRDMWEKVIFNLLSNALKFTPEGSISVAVGHAPDSAGPGSAVVTVRDTGIGVPSSEMPRLFERFHRVQTSAARSSEGSGIGLALVKELVSLHGGTITAESPGVAEGAGTTFTIRIPLGAGHLPTDASIANPGAGSAEAAGDRVGRAAGQPYVQEALRWTDTLDHPVAFDADEPAGADTRPAALPATVLVADDNADMREYLTRLLQSAGYRVVAVPDGRRALDALQTEVPDLVISDVMMPHIDGLELVAALREDVRTALVPVVLLSARAGQEASIEGLHAGADDYLVKPFSSGELLARVETNIALARQRNRHANWRSALVHSLQEGFFVCDQDGEMVEINAGFADIVGYGPEGLPYRPPFPWWPDPVRQPEEHQRAIQVYDAALQQKSHQPGDLTFAMNHRDGHQVWVDISLSHAEDPLTGRLMMVGTFRDVTAEHYRVQRQTALSELNEQLAQANSLTDTVGAAARHLQRLFGATAVWAAIFVASGENGGEPRLLTAGSPSRWADLPERTRRRVRDLAERSAALVPVTDAPGAAGIALEHPDGVLALWIELGEHRKFNAEEQTLLTVLAGRLAQGLRRVHQLDQQRETALALQHAILSPAELPVGFAARYQPATRPLEVGGDWYDVAPLGDGRIAMVVGDCVGHGLSAATVMGQLRSACRALLLQRLDPADTLVGLDRFAAGLAGARCTTACAAVLDTRTGEMTYSIAGHPPPVLVHADGDNMLLDDARSLPLGVRPNQRRPVAQAVVPPGATVLFYTDGLVERRRVSVDSGTTRATDLLTRERRRGLDELAEHLMTGMAPDGGYQDDVAILLYRRPEPLELTFPGRLAEIGPARAALREWLTTGGVDAQRASDVLLAAGEAVSNAVEHGHRDDPDGLITLRAALNGGTLQLSVADTGRWKIPQPDRRRGRGTMFIKALMDSFVVERTIAGTTVRMSTTLQ
jgi:PAS domain S-box-containing protein